MKNMLPSVKSLVLALLLLHQAFISFAQTGPHDFEFWFGVPEWRAGINSPQQIHFTGSGATTSYYEIDMPASPSFTPITGSVPAGSAAVVNMTTLMNQIVTTPANTVLDRGLRIKIWGKMGAYYANERSLNYGTIPLRGPNALGTDFIVPGQNVAPNRSDGNPSSFVVTATEDNTVVTITPSEPIVGHGANVSFTISLNRGQSYQAQNTIRNGKHLAGSTIHSNNRIVVTYIDDYMTANSAADNGGDQLIPNTGLGTDYVQIRTNLPAGWEYVFFTGIHNGTTVTVFDGINTTTLILDKGELKSYLLPTGINAAYIHSDKPISAYQLGGTATAELGSGILTPVVNCTGTDIVAFQRPTSANTTHFNVIVPSGAEGNFLLNGSATILTAADFLDVPGYPGWKYARKNVTGNFTAGQTIITRNTTSKFFFYQNLASGGASTGGGDFSNFSDFGNVLCFPKVTRDCNTGKVTLDSRSVAYNAAITNHSWTGPNGFSASGPATSAVVLDSVGDAQTGWYRVQITGDNGCSITDSMYVGLPVGSVAVVPQSTVACAGSSIIMTSSATAGAQIDSIRWTGPNGFTSSLADINILNASTAHGGTYTVRYYDAYGCFKEASATITMNTASSIPPFAIGGEHLLSCGFRQFKCHRLCARTGL